jgi:dienelactone hydrolase
MDFGWYGHVDIAAAVSLLVNQPAVDPDRVGVMGLSMGGEEALGAAAADPRIKAVVAEGATARSERDKQWLADLYGLRGRVQLGLEWLQYSLTDLLTSASKPAGLADAVTVAGRPVLLITAGSAPDEGHAAEHLRERSPTRVSTWTVPGAAHTQSLAVDPQRWETTVVGFLGSVLGP